MKAKDLKPGHEFKLKGQRKFKPVRRTLELKSPESMKGKYLIVLDNCKQIILDAEQEVIIDENYPLLPSCFLTPINDYKAFAVKSIFYEHQGLKFNPCMYLIYWIRWGKYIFDIRDVYQLFGKDAEKELTFDLGSAAFQAIIESMLTLIGNEPFKNILLKVHEIPTKVLTTNTKQL